MSKYIEKLNMTNPLTNEYRKKWVKEFSTIDLCDCRKYNGVPKYIDDHVLGNQEKPIKIIHYKIRGKVYKHKLR